MQTSRHTWRWVVGTKRTNAVQDEEHGGIPLAARLLGPVELHVAAVAHADRLLVVFYLRRGAHDGEVELQQRTLRPEGRLEVEQPAAPREQPPAQRYALEIKTLPRCVEHTLQRDLDRPARSRERA